jgi:hypothetical protein
MNTSIYRFTTALLIFVFGLQQTTGQQKGAIYVGLAPDITVEKEYEKGEFDINIAPLVFQYYLTNSIALRAATTVNLHVGNGSEVSHVGGQIALPVYLFSGAESFASGFYLAPVIGLSHNQISEGNEITTTAEAGYSWITESGFTMNLGIQLGGTYFTANDESAGWRNHWGIKYSLGYTF